MLNKNIKEITLDDINRLIEGSAREGKQLEFKEILPGNREIDKKEFLADVSSFANTAGGYIIYGVKEDGGVAEGLTPLISDDFDKEILRLENIIQDGLEPRIRLEIKLLDLEENKLLLIHIHKSWLSPHRVVFQNSNRFFARNSAGKYELDTQELRTAFNLSDSIADKIKNFKDDRMMKLIANETPINFTEGSKVVLHFIPFESFNQGVFYDLEKYHSSPADLRPMYCSGWSSRRNLNGFLTYSGNKNDKSGKFESYSYTQLYRNGIIEAVNGILLERERSETPFIPYVVLEEEILKCFVTCVDVMKNLSVGAPVVFYLSLIDVKGYEMPGDGDRRFRNTYPIDQDNLFLPEVIIDNFEERAEDILRPIFDLVWNACGIKESKNFDKDNNWIAKV